MEKKDATQKKGKKEERRKKRRKQKGTKDNINNTFQVELLIH